MRIGEHLKTALQRRPEQPKSDDRWSL